MSAEQNNDPGSFRFLTAGFVKDLLAARAKTDPDFVTPEMHKRWGLDADFPGPFRAELFLDAARERLDEIYKWPTQNIGSLSPHNLDDANVKDAKLYVKRFVTSAVLQKALSAAENGQQIDWENGFRWDELDAIRDLLDLLPHPRQSEEKSDLAAAIECHVTLSQMAAIVNKSKKTLERMRDDGKLSAPAVKGGTGRADASLAPIGDIEADNQQGPGGAMSAIAEEEVAETREEYVFVNEGGVFRIEAFGESCSMPINLKGFRQIHRVLEAPGNVVSMIELVTLTTCDVKDDRSIQEAMDEQTRRECLDQLKVLRIDRSEAEADGDTVVVQECDEEISKIEKQLLKDFNPRGKAHNLNDQKDKLRSTIHGTLKTAHDKLKDANCPLLAEHFKISIQPESVSFVYCPGQESKPEWVTKKT